MNRTVFLAIQVFLVKSVRLTLKQEKFMRHIQILPLFSILQISENVTLQFVRRNNRMEFVTGRAKAATLGCVISRNTKHSLRKGLYK